MSTEHEAPTPALRRDPSTQGMESQMAARGITSAAPVWARLGRRGRNRRPPTLGSLLRRKLLATGRAGLYMAALSFVLNRPLHWVLGIKDGEIRAFNIRVVKRVLQTIRTVLLIPLALLTTGWSVLGLALALTAGRRWMRNRSEDNRGSRGGIGIGGSGSGNTGGGNNGGGGVDSFLETIGQDLHHWAQGYKNLRTFSDKDIGWLVNSAPPEVQDSTPDVTEEFMQRLKRLRTKRSPGDQVLTRFLRFLGLARRKPHLTRRHLIGTLGVPPVAGGWDGLSVLIVPGLLTKRYPLYFATLQNDLERLGIDFSFSSIDTDRGVEVSPSGVRRGVGFSLCVYVCVCVCCVCVVCGSLCL